jgi:hypothetical protein
MFQLYHNIYITHEICQNIINLDDIETILFGSTCKNIILSSGSYSFIIGLLAFYTKNIIYDKNAGKNWHPQYYKMLDLLRNCSV